MSYPVIGKVEFGEHLGVTDASSSTSGCGRHDSGQGLLGQHFRLFGVLKVEARVAVARCVGKNIQSKLYNREKIVINNKFKKLKSNEENTKIGSCYMLVKIE